MKKIYTILCSVLFIVSAQAQQEVYLNIAHQLGEESFEYEKMATNNMSHNFTVTRLEYYISEIKLTHDGGNVTAIEDLWILANGNSDVSVSLGNQDVSQIESISFFIGVDPDHNHLDPAAWPSNHPLAPKAPSMHWGWAAGYRFVAMEGKTGNGLNTTFQLHGLGDENYWETELDVVAREDKEKLHIDLIADYTMALENINLYSGPISHGAIGEARMCLLNFNEVVFSSPGFVSGVNDQVLSEFKLFPNPSVNGEFNVEIPNDVLDTYNIEVVDMTGNTILKKEANSSLEQLSVSQAGMFIVKIISENKVFSTQRIVVQ